ncbi:MAG: cytochrome c [Bacteroidetes bacterium]|jgi:mono/diheme cytochrome c family protein|nr:MAG: cytochrome c [Bacteroidota bacterium]
MISKLLQIVLIITFLVAICFFAGCHDESENPSVNFVSSKTADSNSLKHLQDTSSINQGKSLFQKNCGACHNVLITDNHLAGVIQRVGESYLKLYVTRQDSLIKAKDKYALELKREFENLATVHNFKFSNEQLNAIIAYLKKYSG